MLFAITHKKYTSERNLTCLNCHIYYLEGVVPTRGNDTGNGLEIDVCGVGSPVASG